MEGPAPSSRRCAPFIRYLAHSPLAPRSHTLQARVTSAQAAADALNAATARLFRSFVAHTGSTTVPVPPVKGTAPGSASSSKDGDLWHAVAERNAALNPVAEPSSSSGGRGAGQGLISMFKVCQRKGGQRGAEEIA